MHGREGISPLDKCLRRARYIRDQALTYSASAVFADTNVVLGEHAVESPDHNFKREQSPSASPLLGEMRSENQPMHMS